MTGYMVIPPFLKQHTAHQGHLRLLAQLGQQRAAPGPGRKLFEDSGVNARYCLHG
jgi:hypothetical protein